MKWRFDGITLDSHSVKKEDVLLKAVPGEYTHLDNRIRYVIYGHTHDPLQAAVGLSPGTTPQPYVYLNDGTWRTRYHRCKAGLGFIGWKNITYVIMWKKEERGLDFPSFKSWSGALKTFLP